MCDGTAGVHVVCWDLCCVSRGHSCCCCSWSVTCVHTVCCLYLCLLFFMLTSARDHTCSCPLCARAYSRCLCSWPHWSDSCCSCRVRVGRALDYVSGQVHTWMNGCAMCVFVSGWACVMWVCMYVGMYVSWMSERVCVHLCVCVMWVSVSMCVSKPCVCVCVYIMFDCVWEFVSLPVRNN